MSSATHDPRHSLRAWQVFVDLARARWASIRQSMLIVSKNPAARVVAVAPPTTGLHPEETLPDAVADDTQHPAIEILRDVDPTLTAEEVQRQVLSQQLGQALLQWIAAYRGFGPRDLYLWKWCALGARLTTLPGVDSAWYEHVNDTKVLSIMLNVLVDDVADRREPSPLLSPLLCVVRGAEPRLEGLSDRERDHVQFTIGVRKQYWERVERYPCANVFRELLEYDLDQLFNAIHYSALLNHQLGLLNVVEHDLYSPHNMMMMSFATLDLMCAPAFQAQELGRLREGIWHAQWMGRIGNLLSTWEREIAVGDFTSGVFAQAISRGDLTVGDLERGDRGRIAEIIERGGYHAEYCRRWRYHRECFQRRAGEIRSVDMRPLVAGHDRFFRLHLGSKGKI